MDETRGRHAHRPLCCTQKLVAEWIIIDLLWICCRNLLTCSVRRQQGCPGLAPPLMTRAHDMYTSAADTEEEDIDHFLPPPPTTSLLEMCGSTISANQSVPVAYPYDYHY